MKIVSLKGWGAIEEALMKAEIPYKVTFDSHGVPGKNIYDKIIDIDSFKITIIEEVK